MKRTQIIIFLLAILLICQGAVPILAEEADTKVFMTISDDQGALVLARKAVQQVHSEVIWVDVQAAEG